MSAPQRIHLSGSGKQFETRAAGAITPGHLLEMDTNGKVVVHSTAGGYAEKNVAVEDALQGNLISDAYASGDLVQSVIGPPGDEFYMFLAAGENATKASKLSSNGDGTLRVVTGADVALFQSMEAVNLSDSAETSAARIKVRAL